jgi:hypothetical protein
MGEDPVTVRGTYALISYSVTPRLRRYGDSIFCIHPTARYLRRQQIKIIIEKENRVTLQNSVTDYLTTQRLYNSIMNNTISFKTFQTIIIHYYKLKHVLSNYA